MMNSEPLSPKPSPRSYKGIALAFLLLSLAGFADSTYLTAKHFLGTPVPCSLLEGCETVLSSPYSVVAGIPVALFGSLFYASVFLVTLMYLNRGKDGLLWVMVLLTPFGFLATLWFVYVQIFILHAICLYCMFSAATSTTLFVLGLCILKTLKKSQIEKNV